jgi:Phytanoyl-CoA dioxygenase (PhyH)
MSWIVVVSESERLNGCLSEASAQAAHGAFREHGCVLLRGVFDADSIDILYREYHEQFGVYDGEQMAAQAEQPAPNPVAWVGEGRYDILPHMGGVFGHPQLFANPLLYGLLHPLLGQHVRVSGLTVVVSYPGAEKQHTHRDHPLLFDDPDVAQNIPPYAVNVSIPLIDVDHETGPTGIWLGSHRWLDESRAVPESMTVVPFQRGDCVLLDYRTLHAGLPNRSTVARPIAYIVYTRTWFFDEINHRMRPSLGMTLEQYHNLPTELQPLMMRVYSQHARAGFFTDPREG